MNAIQVDRDDKLTSYRISSGMLGSILRDFLFLLAPALCPEARATISSLVLAFTRGRLRGRGWSSLCALSSKVPDSDPRDASAVDDVFFSLEDRRGLAVVQGVMRTSYSAAAADRTCSERWWLGGCGPRRYGGVSRGYAVTFSSGRLGHARVVRSRGDPRLVPLKSADLGTRTIAMLKQERAREPKSEYRQHQCLSDTNT